MDATIRVPALEKLLDYTASGIGNIAGPMLASWRARREADAKRIAALGEADSLEITAGAQSKALRATAIAQADARATLASPDTTIHGTLDIAQTVSQRVQFQEEKRQGNLAAVVEQAALEVGDKDVPDHEPDHDWTARFFSEVQDVSSEEMQSLWARVLAGEVERPGSTSIQTLSILRNLDHNTSSLFRKLCSICVSLGSNGQILDSRGPSLDGAQEGNSLQKYSIKFGALNMLNEHGLIISDYNSWFDYRMCIDIHPSEPKLGTSIVIPFTFQGRYWTLLPTNQRDHDKEFRLSGVALTLSGRELSSVVDLEPMEEYAQALVKFFQKKKMQMTEVDSPLPRVV